MVQSILLFTRTNVSLNSNNALLPDLNSTIGQRYNQLFVRKV